MKSSRHVWWRRLAVLAALLCPLALFANGDLKTEAKPEKKTKVRRAAKSVRADQKKVTITGSNLRYSARDAKSHLSVKVIDRKALDRTGRPNLTDALILRPSLSRTGL